MVEDALAAGVEAPAPAPDVNQAEASGAIG
jgi:hypothetical protein